MHLDNPSQTLDALHAMSRAGGEAFQLASEDGGLNGAVRDLLFGLNSAIDALASLVEEQDS